MGRQGHLRLLLSRQMYLRLKWDSGILLGQRRIDLLGGRWLTWRVNVYLRLLLSRQRYLGMGCYNRWLAGGIGSDLVSRRQCGLLEQWSLRRGRNYEGYVRLRRYQRWLGLSCRLCMDMRRTALLRGIRDDRLALLLRTHDILYKKIGGGLLRSDRGLGRLEWVSCLSLVRLR